MRLKTEDFQKDHHHRPASSGNFLSTGATTINSAEDWVLLEAKQQRTDRYLDRLGASLATTRNELQSARLAIVAHAEAELAARTESNRLLAEIEQRDAAIATLHHILKQREKDIALAQTRITGLNKTRTNPTLDTVPVGGNLGREGAIQQSDLLRRLRAAEEDSALQKAVLNLSQEILQIMASPGKWWNNLIPNFFTRRLKYDRLRKKGLFDARLYLKRYPDVGRARSDPLHHYITHGLNEGRTRT